MILKLLIRIYFLDLAMETAFDKIVYNFLVPPESRVGKAQIEWQRLISKFRMANATDKAALIESLATFNYAALFDEHSSRCYL